MPHVSLTHELGGSPAGPGQIAVLPWSANRHNPCRHTHQREGVSDMEGSGGVARRMAHHDDDDGDDDTDLSKAS